MKSAQSTRARSRASWVLALAALIAACASTDGDLAAARDSWRGATYDQVLMAWGTPSQSSVDSHTWLSDDSAPRTPGSSGGVGGMIFAAARCDRTLAFRDGRVVDGRWNGDAEFCKRYARR
ncbi:MAG TPA: hypothetical protein VEX61_03315 [Burkholderiales bacterium]|nr:hypothetical protein [Burkholderiales bacterium]